MKKLSVLLCVLVSASGALAQKSEQPVKEKEKTPAVVADVKTNEPLELAKKALAAHGGEKFKNAKTMIVRGSADLAASPTQSIPSSFVMIYSGDKYRLDVINPFRPFNQIYDGERTLSSIPGVLLPPINRLGLPLLQRFEQTGFVVSGLPEKNKAKKGFRITSPEGFYTDFFVDEKTGEVKAYEASFDNNGTPVTTSVEIDKLREVDGVKVPEKYAQRFELGFGTFYGDFKAKEILINSPVADDVFTLSK